MSSSSWSGGRAEAGTDHCGGAVDAALPELEDDVTINEQGEPVLKRVVGRRHRFRRSRWSVGSIAVCHHAHCLMYRPNIEHWSHFTRHFWPVAGTMPKLKKAPERYFQTLFAMGCNLGPTQAASHFTSPVSAHMLSLVHRKHMTIEQLEVATRELSELNLRLELLEV